MYGGFDMVDEPLDVKKAYALRTPADSRALYADWAQTYDSNFAAAVDYIFPQQVADVFFELNGVGPVLDAGAGTGLVGQALRKHADVDIDAFDISPEMLAIAASKDLYRDLTVGDLTKPLPIQDGMYNAVVSAGTFTHGHVGPEAIDELLRVAAPGALFVLTIKAELYEPQGFADKFQSFGSKIEGFAIRDSAIYGSQADREHAGDLGFIATFWRS